MNQPPRISIRFLANAAVIFLALSCLGFALEPVMQASADTTAIGNYFVIFMLLNVATAVMFLRWLFRARVNAGLLTGRPHRRHPAWMVFGWVVPPVCLWFPKQILDDIWDVERPGRSGVIWAWWLTWVGPSLAGVVATTFGLSWPPILDLASTVLTVVCGALACVMILQITAAQQKALAKWRDSGQSRLAV